MTISSPSKERSPLGPAVVADSPFHLAACNTPPTGWSDCPPSWHGPIGEREEVSSNHVDQIPNGVPACSNTQGRAIQAHHGTRLGQATLSAQGPRLIALRLSRAVVELSSIVSPHRTCFVCCYGSLPQEGQLQRNPLG